MSNWIKHKPIAVVAALVMCATFGMVPATHAQDGRVTGTVTYRERIALAAGAVVTVQLLDVSLQDVAATTIDEQRITTTGNQVPFAFGLSYDPAQVVDTNTYAVRATIEENGALRWTTTQQYPVITRGNPTTVDLVLEQVAAPAPTPTAGALPDAIVGATWNLVSFQRADGTVDDTSGTALTIMFDAEGRASGNGGCNTFGATYTAGANGALTFAQLLSTLRACESNEVTTLESAYFAALNQVASYAQDSADQLRLNAGDLTLTYRRDGTTPPETTTPPSTLPDTGSSGIDAGAWLMLAATLAGAGIAVRRRRWSPPPR